MAVEEYCDGNFLEELQEAYDKSSGEWWEGAREEVCLGVTGEMLRWFQRNLNDELYRMWCPGPHKSFKRLEFSDVWGEVVEESPAPYRPVKFLLRHPGPETSPWADSLNVPINQCCYVESIDLNGRILFKILHECLPYKDKTIMKTRYLLPKAVNERARKAFVDHQNEEYRFEHFLPQLYREKTWMTQEVCAVLG